MTPCEFCKSIIPLEQPARQRGNPDKGSARILIVEDDPLIGQDLTDRLQGLGYQIISVISSAAQAVALATEQAPDLVLMDINLTGEMDGIQAAEQIRSLQVALVFVTGCCSDTVLQRAAQTEPCGYVVKPYETEDLKATIQVALHKHRAELERHRLVQRLQDVLASVKTMSGRLSICAYCKRIKDASGDWPQVETYVMEHSHASFTHGMCPGCFERVKAQLQALEGGATGAESLVLG